MDMLYLAVSPGREGHVLNEEFIRRQPNQLAKPPPSAEAMAQVLWMVDSDASTNGGRIFLNVDFMKQRCYRGDKTS
jgi:hypothetical protein